MLILVHNTIQIVQNKLILLHFMNSKSGKAFFCFSSGAWVESNWKTYSTFSSWESEVDALDYTAFTQRFGDALTYLNEGN